LDIVPFIEYGNSAAHRMVGSGASQINRRVTLEQVAAKRVQFAP
jgi:hypothetical protein